MLLLADLAAYLYEDDHEFGDIPDGLDCLDLNAHDKVKLMRGLCDRIEEKLQEVQANG